MFLETGIAHPIAALVIACWVAFVTPRLVVVDVTEHRLPNALVMPGWWVAGFALLIAWLAAGRFPLTAGLAGVVAAIVLIGLSLAGGLGMGDAKLAIPLVVGAALVHPVNLGLGILTAIFAGGIAGVVALLRGRGASARIPFGPWLLLGYWVAWLA